MDEYKKWSEGLIGKIHATSTVKPHRSCQFTDPVSRQMSGESARRIHSVVILPGTVNFGSQESSTTILGFRTKCAKCSQVTFDLFDVSESDTDLFRLDISLEDVEALTDWDCVAAKSSLGGGFL